MDATLTVPGGRHIPRLGFGTYLIPSPDTEQVVTEALRAGYRHIDTASYYRNEAGIGAAVRTCGLAREDSSPSARTTPTMYAGPSTRPSTRSSPMSFST
jgi:diketogulonate reductase-like aldo/keto reductase